VTETGIDPVEGPKLEPEVGLEPTPAVYETVVLACPTLSDPERFLGSLVEKRRTTATFTRHRPCLPVRPPRIRPGGSAACRAPPPWANHPTRPTLWSQDGLSVESRAMVGSRPGGMSPRIAEAGETEARR